MLYLVAVFAAAVLWGRGPAILVSFGSFLAFNWFFVEPLHTFTVAEPDQWVALLLLLLTAIVTSQLAVEQRRRAREAKEREREALFLYDVVRLMSDPDLDHAMQFLAERLVKELDLQTVGIYLHDEHGTNVQALAGDIDALPKASSHKQLPTRHLREGAMLPSQSISTKNGEPGRWVRVVPPSTQSSSSHKPTSPLRVVPIKVQEKRVGELLLLPVSHSAVFKKADNRLLLAVASQLGLGVERIQYRRSAMEAEILRRTDELKTALLNAVSHDLRTPLSSIIASSASLRQTDVPWTESDRQEFVQAIEEEAQRLNHIIGNLLDLSRMESGSLRPEMGWYDLRALIDDVLGRLRPLTVHHRVIVDAPEELPPILIDYVEIDQVLSNLVENAVKYTPADTEIVVAACVSERQLEVTVSDRGPGIPGDSLPHLFEPFYRGDGVGPRPKGTGLGLAVARGLIEAHGGRIWAENRPDGGARFVFTLPLVQTNDVDDMGDK
jgi:two-component system sensor histidine kinase KdpD